MEERTVIEHCKSCSLKIRLFQFLNNDELEIINRSRFEVYFNPGETIFKQGGPLTHIACITKGMVKVYLEGKENKSVILKIIKPMEIIGGPGFQIDNRHHFSVSALVPTQACFIGIDSFDEVLSKSADFSKEFLKHLNTSTIHLYEKLQNLTQKQMHGRLADTLLYLSNAVYMSDAFETGLSRQDIADLSAMTKESAIRIIKEFRDAGVITCEGNQFRILSQEKLEQISKSG